MPKDTLIKRAKLQEKAPVNQVQFKKARKMCYLKMLITSVIIRGGGWGGVLLGILGRGVPPGYPILTLFQIKTCHFPDPFSDMAHKIHTRFQTFVAALF